MSLAKSSEDFSQSQAKTKDVCSQRTNETTAGPFNFLLMGPMSMMLPCYEGSVWLILDMPCPLGISF
jgi:hypothetical protein